MDPLRRTNTLKHTYAMKYKSPKLKTETLQAIWAASRGSVQKNKKKYSRKTRDNKKY